jgi:hypothetical protein
MFRRVCLTAATLALGSSAAFASTFTYTSQPLSVRSEGGNGATQVVISFTGDMPVPGHCVLTQQVISYRDGAHTIKSLKRDNYRLTKTVIGDDKKTKVTYARVCLGHDGQTVTGQYQIYFTYTSGFVFGQFYANNFAYYVPGDLVELDLYLGGEVPQVYSNASNTQGTWAITP